MKDQEQQKKNPVEQLTARVPARIIATVIGLSIFTITVLLLVSMSVTKNSFTNLKEESIRYMRLREAATELQEGSDELTDQVRYYVATGKREHLDGYFEEANVVRRRDIAIETISREAAGSKADQYLQEAMQCSQELMNREYYAMRLMLAAQDEEEGALADHPELKTASLTEEDLALSPENKKKKALTIVMDDEYQEQKNRIQDNISHCLEDLLSRMFSAQEQTSRKLGGHLQQQTILIAFLLGLFLLFVLFVHFSVFSPMRKAIEYIRDNHAIPLEGGREFRSFAKTINELRDEEHKKTGKLAFESTHDPVTGVYNRIGYEHLLEELDLTRAAFLLVDVDLFKQVNDTHGHEVGDRILAEVAGALLSHFRPQDHICRIGGDEFAVIAGHIDRGRADTIVQKIDQINRSLRETEPEIAVSISVGIAFGNLQDTPEQIFVKADKALYEVKRNGRGHAAVYHEDL